ncbi:MAG: leucine-rich repeat domain-containing protein [Holosporaceae bacterium]
MLHFLRLCALGLIIVVGPILCNKLPAQQNAVKLNHPDFDVAGWDNIERYLQREGITPKAVEELELANCNLTSVPKWIAEKMPNLRELSLQQNQISQLPDNLFDLHHLTLLNLEANQITALPKAIGNLRRLDSLHLAHNNLKNLPSTLRQLVSLQYLDLSHNQIGSLPDLTGLNNLLVVTLDNNKDLVLPRSIGQLHALQSLELRNCNLKTVPNTFDKLNALGFLHLKGNPLIQQGSGNQWGKNELTQKFGHRVHF